MRKPDMFCKHHDCGRRAFTLVELLAVIAIAAIIMSAVLSAYVQARRHAKVARAQAELRELLKAWSQYYLAYNGWPASLDGKTEVPMDYAGALQPLYATLAGGAPNPDNPKGIPFLNIAPPVAGQQYYQDPWKNPYRVSFTHGKVVNETALRISVSFPNTESNRP
jgi:prepilin-type N-terminal cleavage/methylation domain-containing protein